MNSLLESIALWLADYYLLASALVALALAVGWRLQQPAQRLAVAKSTIVALVMLAALCLLPGWSLVHLVDNERAQPGLPAVVSATDAPTAPLTAQLGEGPPLPLPAASSPPPSAIVRQTLDPPTPQTISLVISWAVVLTVVHALGAACVFAWLAAGSLAARRLRRTADPAPTDLVALMNEVAGVNQDAARQVKLLVSDRIDVAVALGIWRPVVLLPASWINSHSHAELRSVLAHESAHIHNHDLRWLAASRAVLLIVWANPLYWLLRRRMRLDQEALADAAAAELTSRQRYAEQLVAWAREVGSRPAVRLSSAVGLWEGPSQLRRRIAVLLDERLNTLRNCSRRWRVASLVACALAAVGLSLLTLEPGKNSQTRAEAEPNNFQSELAADGDRDSRDSTSPTTPRRFVRIVAGPNGQLTFEGQQTSWDTLADLLEKVPNRSETVLEFAIATEDISVREMDEARTRAMLDANRFDFLHGSYIGVHPLGSKGTTAPADRAKDDELKGVPSSDTPREVVQRWLELVTAGDAQESWQWLVPRQRAVLAPEEVHELRNRAQIEPKQSLGDEQTAMVVTGRFEDNSNREVVAYFYLRRHDGRWLIYESNFATPDDAYRRIEGFVAHPGVRFHLRRDDFVGTWIGGGLLPVDHTFEPDGAYTSRTNNPDGTETVHKGRWEIDPRSSSLIVASNGELRNMGQVTRLEDDFFQVSYERGQRAGFHRQKKRENDVPQSPSNDTAADQSRAPLHRAPRPTAQQSSRPVDARLIQHTSRASNQPASAARPPALLSYGDGKPDGKKSYGGSGHMIRFELPEGVTKVRGIRIHGSRYGLPQAPKEDFEITFLSEDRDETLHSEAAPYRLFQRGKENWVRVLFQKELELPQKFWIALNFNAHQTKGVYLSYDTSTKGEYSRVGRPGEEDEPKETDFGGDWMVQLMLSRPRP